MPTSGCVNRSYGRKANQPFRLAASLQSGPPRDIRSVQTSPVFKGIEASVGSPAPWEARGTDRARRTPVVTDEALRPTHPAERERHAIWILNTELDYRTST